MRENQIIGVEDLNIKGMVKNRRLAKSISSVSWSEFFRMLDYKCAWYGSSLMKIDRFYPSSQVCSVCGCQNPDIKNLSIREWDCPQCNSHHDRDVNAAKNILSQALTQIN